MRKRNIKYLLLFLIISTFACNDTDKCFKPYVKEINQSHNPYYEWGYSLYFRTDSILHKEGKCEYVTETFIALNENTISYEAALYIECNQIIARLIDLKSEPFTLFDFQAQKGTIYPIEIKKTSTPTIRHAKPIQKFSSYVKGKKVAQGQIVCTVDKTTVLSSFAKAVPFLEFLEWVKDLI